MDPAPRIWFHALPEVEMAALERLTHRVTVQGGIIVVASIVVASLVVVLMARGDLALPVAQAQQTGSKRTDLQRQDLSAPGREVVQVRVDFDPGYVAPRHTHPGEEIIYVIEGSLEYEIDGKRAKVKAGDVLFVPAGAIHTAKNVGSGNGAELATYIVEKGKPLLTVVK
jgi:quercetin dioxygenase-like cupin family protein